MSTSQDMGTNGLDGAAEKDALRLRDIVMIWSRVRTCSLVEGLLKERVFGSHDRCRGVELHLETRMAGRTRECDWPGASITRVAFGTDPR